MLLTLTTPHQPATDLGYPNLFATISGVHLHGFLSPESNFDRRGAHLLPMKKVLGMEAHASYNVIPAG